MLPEPSLLDKLDALCEEPVTASELRALLHELYHLHSTLPAPRVIACCSRVAHHLQHKEVPDIRLLLHNILADAYWRDFDYDNAHKFAREALAQAQSLADKIQQSIAYSTLGNVAERLSDYPSAQENFEKSLALRVDLGDKRHMAIAYNNLGNVQWNLGNYAKALDYLQRSLLIKSELGDVKGEAVSLNNIGNVYIRLNDYLNAVDSFQKSLERRDATSDQKGKAVTLGNLGEVYSKLGRAQEAEQAFEKSLSIRKILGDRTGEASMENSLGRLRLSLERVLEAMESFERALKIRESVPDLWEESISWIGLGRCAEKQARYDDALKFFQKSLRIRQAILDRRGEAESLKEIGRLHAITHQPDASEYLFRALHLAESMNLLDEAAQIHHELALYFKSRKEFENAFEHLDQFHRAERNLFNQITEQKIHALMIQVELDETKRDAEYQKKLAVTLQAQNEKLAAAKQVKTDLLNIAAHDLKNPLQIIMGFAEIIAERVSDDRETVQNAEFISRSSQRMFKLIEKFLDASALDDSSLRLNKLPVKIGTLISQAITLVEPVAKKKSQTIHVVATSDAVCSVDAERMTDVFENLLSNAVKYSPKGAGIWVRLENADESKSVVPHAAAVVRITVKDEGLGLSDDDKTKLFGKFQKLSARPTAGEHSTGLGLAIVKQIVELHGGKVWAASEGKEKGTTFFVELESEAS
jgi:signal transduction histidine kinase/Tfp pilus assembly protein PilF